MEIQKQAALFRILFLGEYCNHLSFDTSRRWCMAKSGTDAAGKVDLVSQAKQAEPEQLCIWKEIQYGVWAARRTHSSLIWTHYSTSIFEMVLCEALHGMIAAHECSRRL